MIVAGSMIELRKILLVNVLKEYFNIEVFYKIIDNNEEDVKEFINIYWYKLIDTYGYKI